MKETNKKHLNIRKSTIKDVSLILKLIKELAVFEKMENQVSASEESLRESLFGDIPYAHVLIAEYKSVPVGYALYFFNFSTFLGRPGLYLEDIFVLENYRGKGIGMALFKECASIAKEKKCNRMDWVVLDWNPARTWYDSIGGKALKEWVLYRLKDNALDKLVDL